MKNSLRSCVFFFALLALPLLSADDANAQVRGCAADTWRAMNQQAVLEAQRENLFNETYIVKPDSVLQYTCFREGVEEDVAGYAAPIFSQTDAWHNRIVDISGTTVTYTIPMNVYFQNSLSSALDNVIYTSLQTYLNANFNHTPLGGT